MNYFVDVDLGGAITGIEQAGFNRLRLFEQAEIPATIVYLTYKPRHHEFAKKFGIQGSSFTMYDYFQESQRYADLGHFDWRNYWEKTCHYKLQFIDVANDIRVSNQDGLFLMYASFYDADYTRVNYINYFDKNHRKIRRDIYDSRGFLSCTCLLAEKDLLNTELYYNQQGKVRIIKQYLIANGKNFLREVSLKNYKGHDYYFGNEEELRTFFFDELFNQGDMYFADRIGEMIRSFNKTKPEVKVTAIVHSTHVRVGSNVMDGPLKLGTYDYTLQHPERLSAIVVSTHQQREDLLARFDNLPPVVTIPVGFAYPQPFTRNDFEERNPHRIISVARYSPEKQLLHQVMAVERLIPEFPDVELHLLGYGATVGNILRKYIDEHHLEEHVFMRGFQKDLTEDYRKGSLSLMTSKEEGFSLSTLESLSFSVPMIAYNINYGPKEMIVDGENGFLVKADNQEELYQKMRQFLGHKSLQIDMMKNCQKLIKAYLPDTVMHEWQTLLHKLK